VYLIFLNFFPVLINLKSCALVDMSSTYTLFFIDFNTSKDFLRDIKFPCRSQFEIHVFHRKDTKYNELVSAIPSTFYEDGRPISVRHSSLTNYTNAVEDALVHSASSYDFSRFKKPEVYLVSGENRRYEELAKILRRNNRVSAWMVDGKRTNLLDWLDTGLICKSCRIIFDTAKQGVEHFDEFHMS
jgi:hypothetical protein